MRVCRLLMFFCVLVHCAAAPAATYYFSSSLGNDSWSGTLQNPNAGNSDGPKRSLAALQSLLNDVAAPGDTIFLRAGDSWTSASSLVLNSATTSDTHSSTTTT
jgi:hypothetical protein